MSPLATVEVTVLCVCVVVSALASGTETALTSVGRLRVRHLAEEGSKAAAKLQRLQADPNRFLSTVLFVNTVALIVASSMSTLLSVEYLPHSVGFWCDLAVPLTATLEDIAAVFREHKHTRMPVYDADIDHVKGLIHVKDLLLYYVGHFEEFDIKKALRKIEFVPETRKVDEALHDMQTKKV